MKSLINTPIPEFSVEAFSNGKFIEITDRDLMGHWSVLFFYPADFENESALEIAGLGKRAGEFEAPGCTIYVVSTDSCLCHKAWSERDAELSGLPFAMLSDKNGNLSEAFGVLDAIRFVTYRSTAIISPEGVVKATESYDNCIVRNPDELLRKLRCAQVIPELGALSR